MDSTELTVHQQDLEDILDILDTLGEEGISDYIIKRLLARMINRRNEPIKSNLIQSWESIFRDDDYLDCI